MKRMKNVFRWIGLLFSALLLAACIAPRGTLPNALTGEDAASEVTSLIRGPLSVTINAIGNVRPAQSATLAWQTGGQVGEVNVTVGEKVEAEQELATLDPTSLPNNILQAEIDLINAQNALEDLSKPDELAIAQAQEVLEQAQEALDALRNPSESDIAQAELAVINAQEEIDDAEYELNSLLNGRGNDRLISEARAKLILAQDRVDQLQAIFNNTPGNSNEDAGKAQALANLEGAKRDRDRALASLNWYLGEPSEQELAEKRTNLALAQAKLADAEQFLVDLQNPSPSAITLAEAKVADAQENLDQLLSGPKEDEVIIAQTRITQAEATLNQAHLTAPFAGTITEVNVLAGDQVTNGQKAFRIDDLSTYYVDLQVSEIDIPQIEIGDPVRVIFDAILEKTYTGVVDSIGQVGVSTQNVVNFTVTIRLTDPDGAIKPGMTAEANIQVAEVDDVLQLPNRFIFEEDGKRYVYRLNGEESERVYVQVGLSSESASEIISESLKEGDQVTSQPGLFAGFGGGPPEGVRNQGGNQP
jgi:HlyD family secretion protein